MRWALMAALALRALAGDAVYEVSGKIEPRGTASVSIYGTTSPFSATMTTDYSGKFKFRRLPPGTYMLAAIVARRGEARKTVEVGPGSADSSKRVMVTVRLDRPEQTARELRQRGRVVTAAELSISEKARAEYRKAQKSLSRRNVEDARAHLEKAVAIAPRYSAAWNNLGTIAYQTRNFEQAEGYFRHAVAADSQAYEAMVNLGGVLVTLNRPEEARGYNQKAVQIRPNDALANSQLGMTYFQLDQLDRAERYLKRAIEIDPAHFSYPQALLSEVHLREGKRLEAAADLEGFLRHHPDFGQADEYRKRIAELRK